MRSLLKGRRKKHSPPIEPLAASFPSMRDAEIAAATAGRRNAGDFYDSIRVGPSRVLFGLVEVTGGRKRQEGVFAAAQKVFRESGADLLAGTEVNEANALSELCLQLNRTIIQTAGTVHSCPAFAGCYNEDLGTVCYFNAGHTPGLVRHGEGVSELPPTGLPLGLFSHTTSDAQMIALEPGAALLVVSRGVVEVKRKGHVFGLTGVERALLSANRSSAQEACTSVLDTARAFTGKPAPPEDLTALVLLRRFAN